MLGCIEYVGWYDGLPEKADRLTWRTQNKPLVISEFGADALFGYHGDKSVRWTEEYQRDLTSVRFPCLRRFHRSVEYRRGRTDFRSPRRPSPRIQDFYNRKGLISSRGERKQAFYVLQGYRELMKAGK